MTPRNTIVLAQCSGRASEQEVREALSAAVGRYELLAHREPDWDCRGGTEAAPDELFRRERERRFDLERGPLVHGTFARQDHERAALILTFPAAVADAHSAALIAREIVTREAAPSAPSYAQYVQWQTEVQASTDESARLAKDYWNRQNALQNAPLAMPLEMAGAGEFRPDSVPVSLPATPLGDSPANVLLAAWQALLWRLTGRPHFTTRVFFHAREFEALENVIGPVGRFVPIAARFDGEFSFHDVLAHVRTAMSEALEWHEYFVPAAGPADVVFEYTRLAPEIARTESSGEPFTLKLSAQQTAGALTVYFHYDADRIDREMAEMWSGHFQTLLDAALKNPDFPLSRQPILSASERRRLLDDWNQTAVEYSRSRSVHELFELQAARTPDRDAVRFGEHTLCYRELNERANRLAHHLRQIGVGPGGLTGLCVERGLEMIVALLAILKAGSAYVPLDADNPKPRLERQLAGAAALVTERAIAPRLPDFNGPVIYTDSDASQWAQAAVTNPEILNTPENLVYVIFTSGSTGVPKGVSIRHRSLVNYIEFIERRLHLDRYPNGLHFATVSTLSADLGNTAIFPALISGGCVHVIAEDTALDSARLARYCREYPIDVLKIVPSHLEALLATAEGAGVLPRNYLILGGEALSFRLVERIQELGGTCEIGNHYGPTETTVESVVLRWKDYEGKKIWQPSLPIGKPVANTQIYILDALLQPVPVGVAGELYIAGDGVAAGYLNQPDVTAERFLPNPFLAGGAMYRSGDLCRYLPDGNVDFLGRADDQVKIRGFRIELGEVEAMLARHPCVKQAAVIARPDERGDKRLIAYVVAVRDLPATPEMLRGYLHEQLPDYMVPAAVVLLPKLPLNANGKIDRRNLPEPEAAPVPATGGAPLTGTQEALALIWTEVLGRACTSATENFFDAGGHSLAAIQVISRVRERFRITLEIDVVFDRPTIGELAESIETAQAAGTKSDEPDLAPVSREAYRRRS